MITSTGAVLVSNMVQFDITGWSRPRRMNARAVYAAVALHCGEDLTAFPSLRRLADCSFLSTRSVTRTLADLIEHGYLRRVSPGGAGRAPVYQWLNPEGITLNSGADVRPGAKSQNAPGHVVALPTRVTSTRDIELSDMITDRSWAYE